MSRFLAVLGFLAPLMLVGCTSLVIDSYLEDVDAQVQPVWQKTMDASLRRAGVAKVPYPVESRVEVTLDPTGKVLEVRLARSSGLDYINTASVDTFRQLGKLPVPPGKMVLDGRVHLDWGFIVTE